MFTGGFLSFFDKNDAILFKAPLASFWGFFKTSSAKVTLFTTASGLDKGLLVSFKAGGGISGAGLHGTFGAFLNGEINSLAVQVEFSKIGDEIIGLALEPGFGGGKAGATEALFALAKAVVKALGLYECDLVTGLFKNTALSAVVFALCTVGVFTATVGTGGTAGTGGAARTGSGSFCLSGVSVNPANWPQKSLVRPLIGASL